MKVEWIGGPDDGKTIEVHNKFREINVPMPNSSVDYTDANGQTKSIPIVEFVTLPIMIDHVKGKAFINYSYNKMKEKKLD